MNLLAQITDRLRSFVKNDCGGTLAELAILIPFLAVMLAAVSDLGNFFQTYTTASKATRTAARYLSNHALTPAEKDKAKSLVVCGKLTACADGDRLVRGIETTNVCIESTGTPTVVTVTVRIPYSGDCTAPLAAGETPAVPLVYDPIFDIGALLHNSFSMALPIAPGTTMPHRLD